MKFAFLPHVPGPAGLYSRPINIFLRRRRWWRTTTSAWPPRRFHLENDVIDRVHEAGALAVARDRKIPPSGVWTRMDAWGVFLSWKGIQSKRVR
jgi:hypothetical protein